MDIDQYASPAIQDMLTDARPFIGATGTCPDCGRPQHYTGLEHGWAHDALIDMWDCADPKRSHSVAL